MEKFLKQYSLFIFTIAISILSTFLVTRRCSSTKSSSIVSEGTEYVDSNKTYNKIYGDGDFKDLKSENKKLYDSLRESKDKIDYLLQFKYEKSYSSGKVNLNGETMKNDSSKSRDYIYESVPNDSFEYKLTINSEKEPNYYKLDTRFKDRLTVVNENENGVSHVTIKSEGKGNVGDVTVFHKKKKTKFSDRFAVGPSVTLGYDPWNKNVGGMVGVSLTYNILKK